MAVFLRDYQEEALNSVIKDFQGGVHHQLIVLPTASGKTFVMAAIIKYFNHAQSTRDKTSRPDTTKKKGLLRVLIVAHREELSATSTR